MEKEDILILISEYVQGLISCNVDKNIVSRNQSILEDFYDTKIKYFLKPSQDAAENKWISDLRKFIEEESACLCKLRGADLLNEYGRGRMVELEIIKKYFPK